MRASELERWQSRQGEIVNAHARVGGELRELVIPSAIPDSVDNHWPVQDGETSTTVDTIGEVDLSVSGATLVSDSGAADGHYYEFDGLDDTLVLDDSGDRGHFTDLSSDGVTCLAWVRGTTDDDIMSFFDTSEDATGASSDQTFRLWSSDENIGSWTVVAGGDSRAIFYDITQVLDGDWHLLSATAEEDGNDIVLKVYADDDEIASETIDDAGSFSNNGTRFVIGGAYDESRRMFDGDMEYFGFSRTAMAENDIIQYYNSHPRS